MGKAFCFTLFVCKINKKKPNLKYEEAKNQMPSDKSRKKIALNL